MRLPVNQALPLAALIFLHGCGPAGGGHRPAPLPPAAVTGPAADYPMVLGDPFTIDGKTWTPVDKLNYDAVGHAALAPDGGGAISGAHKLLPLPSYAEVTSLETGRTILVRLERRGPMRNDAEVALSPGAAAQLGVGDNAPVRVRRVNPPEVDRALLRAGQPAPERMETPSALLKVLIRRLDENRPLAPVAAAPSPPAAAEPASPAAGANPAPLGGSPPAKAPNPPAKAAKPPAKVMPPASAAPKPAAAPVSLPDSASEPVQPARPAPPPAAAHGAGKPLVVQVAAFSAQDRADKAAGALGGAVGKPGKFWLVRIGPFATQAEADAALAKARAAGYKDARILRAE